MDDDSEILGRFNFFSYKKDHFNIIFTPYDSPVIITIAKNLTRGEMNELMKRLNNELDITNDYIDRISNGEERK